MQKFAGVGLKNMVVIAMFTMVFIVMAKVVLTKHEINGVTQLVNAV
ncbi:hypothetical protein B4092_4707 [Bacillus licheniformis]|nr:MULTISPECIES: hypothetical protein [Bacillus subtilis group]KYC77732.1 hypothetical protein B4092_4707 [Bacillus licheniformis]TWL81267.1 hypothetical protein CHCC15292_4605 [Bacillus licheniformis]